MGVMRVRLARSGFDASMNRRVPPLRTVSVRSRARFCPARRERALGSLVGVESSFHSTAVLAWCNCDCERERDAGVGGSVGTVERGVVGGVVQDIVIGRARAVVRWRWFGYSLAVNEATLLVAGVGFAPVALRTSPRSQQRYQPTGCYL